MISGSYKIGIFVCRIWEHKSSSPLMGHSRHFVQTGWKTLFILLILSHYIFLLQICNAVLLLNCYFSHLTISLPVRTLQNKNSGGFQSFPEEYWLGNVKRKKAVQFTFSSTGHTWRDIIWVCMHACMYAHPFKDKEIAMVLKIFQS